MHNQSQCHQFYSVDGILSAMSPTSHQPRHCDIPNHQIPPPSHSPASYWHGGSSHYGEFLIIDLTFTDVS